MKPPLSLHRSLLFWSGILVMVFIGWVWWDSMVDLGHGVKRGIAKERAWFAGSARGTCYFFDYSWTASSPKVQQPTSAIPGRMEYLREDFPREAFSPMNGEELPVIRGSCPSFWSGTLHDRQGFARIHLAGPTAGTREEAFISYQTSGFILPYWQLLLAVLLLWVALLLVRARRMRGKMEKNGSPSGTI